MSRTEVGAPVDRAQIEDFLYHEAELLDNWQLDEWLTLLTDDVRYVIPATDLPRGDENTDLVLVGDDPVRVRARVTRLKKRRAHREFPHARTRRLVTNVRIVAVDGDEIEVHANFLVFWIRGAVNSSFPGHYRYRLRYRDGELKIAYRRAELDVEHLDPHGTVSFIL